MAFVDNNGIKELKNATVNDKVYSDSGVFNDILGVSKRKYTGKLYEISTWKGNKIFSSDDHPFRLENGKYIKFKKI